MENKEPEPQVSKSQRLQSKRKWSIGRKILTGLGAVCLLVLLMFVSNILITTMKREKNKEKYEDAEYVKQDTMKYLEERYGEEFEIESVRGMSYAYDYINMYAYPKGFQDEAHKFKIQGRFNEEGNLEYCDSYVMVKLTDDYEAYIDPIIGKYFEEYKFYVEFNSEWLTKNLSPNIKLEDLWELHANEDYPLPTIVIFVGTNEAEDILKADNLVRQLSLSHIRCHGMIAYYDVLEKYKLTGRYLWNECSGNAEEIRTYLIYDDDNYKFYQ